MPDIPTTTRQRGIKASPYKLTRARKAAGFASQAAVAEKIADLEGLDNPPKDVVNRAFRGVKVSADTIERLALALGVEAHTLLWTSDEEEQVGRSVAPATEAAARQPRRAGLIAGAFAVFLALAAVVVLNHRPPAPDPLPPAGQSFAIPELASLADEGTSLMIVSASGEHDSPLMEAIRSALGAHFKVPTSAAAQLAASTEPADKRASISTTAQLTVVTDTDKRWSGIRALLEANGVRRQVWAQSIATHRLAHNANSLAQNLSTAVLVAAGRLRPPPGFFFPLADAQGDVLAGLTLLDRPSREIDLQRAQSRFEAAIRREPDYAQAHAGLCLALLEKYWMLDEARAIEDARLTCARAQALAPNDSLVMLAQSRLLQVTGHNDDAIDILNTLVSQDPINADVWTLLTVSQLTRYQTTGDPSALERGHEAASTAAAADALAWKPYFRLSLIEYLRNDIDAAIRATKLGLARDENSFLLANLGTYQTCAGRLDAAEVSTARAQALAPGAYVGDEFMGQLRYFQGRFAESLALRQKAMASFEDGEPAFHDMWGSLADSYRQTGNDDAAIDAYRQAVSIAETDLLNEDASQTTKAARLYYYARLEQMAPDLLSSPVTARLRAELDRVAQAQNEPAGYRYMAMAYALNDRRNAAQQFLLKATERCGGYRRHPDIVALAIQ